jgi:hypothetical protein
VNKNNDIGRGVGRPKDCGIRGGSASTGKCDVRLSTEELGMLEQLADRNGVTKSDIMRKALRDFHKFNSEKE